MRAVIAWFLLCSLCLAGTRDPLVPDERYLAYGEEHSCVLPLTVLCDCGKKEGRHDSTSSSVAISPRWVLTAAHVVKGKLEPRVRAGGRTFLLKVFVHEGYDERTLGVCDIALCMTDGDLGLGYYPPLYEDRDEAGKVASMCGYGMTGTFATGAVVSDGLKRAGSNVVDSISGQSILCSVLGGRKTSMEFLISRGDSGGGLFLDGKLAGINSFVRSPQGDLKFGYGDVSGHARVSEFVPWIRKKISD